MAITYLSSKGQITLPSRIRRKFGLSSGAQLEIELTDDAILIRPLKTIRELRGIFHRYAEGKTGDWETVRTQTEKAIAAEVADEGKP